MKKLAAGAALLGLILILSSVEEEESESVFHIARYRLPWLLICLFAAFTNIEEMVDLTNIGTLFAFAIVAAGVVFLRIREPEAKRPFRVPLVPLVPLLSIATCLFLAAGLPWITWIRFAVWLAVGLLIYFTYGVRHSALAKRAPRV